MSSKMYVAILCIYLELLVFLQLFLEIAIHSHVIGKFFWGKMYALITLACIVVSKIPEDGASATMLPFVHQGAIRTKKNSQWDWSSDFDSRGLMGLLFIFTMVTILVRAIDTNTQSFNQQFFIEHCLFSRYSVLFWEYKYSSPKEFTMKKTHKEVIAIHCCIHVYVYIKQAGKDVREKHLSAVWSTVRKVRGCQG